VERVVQSAAKHEPRQERGRREDGKKRGEGTVLDLMLERGCPQALFLTEGEKDVQAAGF
jgi:hypothetical protein